MTATCNHEGLRALHLAQCGLVVEDAVKIITQCPRLLALDLSSNSLFEYGLTNYIDPCGMRAGAVPAIECLADAVGRNRSLHALSLARTGLEMMGMAMVLE